MSEEDRGMRDQVGQGRRKSGLCEEREKSQWLCSVENQIRGTYKGGEYEFKLCMARTHWNATEPTTTMLTRIRRFLTLILLGRRVCSQNLSPHIEVQKRLWDCRLDRYATAQDHPPFLIAERICSRSSIHSSSYSRTRPSQLWILR